MAYGDTYALKSPSELGKKSKKLLNQRIYNGLVSNVEQRPLTILEIGVGHGFFAEVCRAQGHQFFGVEPNVVMYKWLLERGFSVKASYCPPVPYKSELFDLVYCGYVLEYLRDVATAYQVVLECHRVLKPGGILGIVSSDYMRMGKEFWNVSYMASFATTERRVRQLYFDAGFEFLRTRFFAGNLFGPWRYFAYIFYKVYNYRLLEWIFRKQAVLDSRFYKLRVSFPEGFVITGKKRSDADADSGNS